MVREPLYAMLYQDEAWRPGGGLAVPLESLSGRHLRNIRDWLFARAELLATSLDYSIASSKLKVAEDVPLVGEEYETDEEWLANTDEEWLANTPLIGRIDELLGMDALLTCVLGPPRG